MKTLITVFLLVALVFSATVPEFYDTRVAFPACSAPIRNQGQCGSCWAFSATTCMSERFCIHSRESMRPMLSPQYILNCNTNYQSGCQGGRMTGAFDYMRSSGCPDQSCVGYYSGNTGRTGPCPAKCDNGSPLKKYFGSSSYSLPARNVGAMQQDIQNRGPITVGFIVYSDFKDFFQRNRTGVYRHTGGTRLGGHGVVIVGWGAQGGVNYWHIHNSWGTGWGDNGYFKMIRGIDDCGIESMMVCAGLPKTSDLPSYAIPLTNETVMLNSPVDVELNDWIMKIALEGMQKVKALNPMVEKLVKVRGAKSQVVAGFNYFFDIELEGNKRAELVVYENPQGEKIVSNFMYK